MRDQQYGGTFSASDLEQLTENIDFVDCTFTEDAVQKVKFKNCCFQSCAFELPDGESNFDASNIYVGCHFKEGRKKDA